MNTGKDDQTRIERSYPTENSSAGITISFDKRKILALFVSLVLILGLLFYFGFLEGRRRSRDGRNQTAVSSPVVKVPQKEFLDPECHIPFNPYGFSFLEVEAADAAPTQDQMIHIRRLLPQDTRIHDISRVDADPPLAFVLHQPKPGNSGATELTVFKFKGNRVEREDLGSFCFIPDFLVDHDGRAFAGWSENLTGGNAWECSSLNTMVIEKGEVSYPETDLAAFQVAKDLILDQGKAVLITWDTRFEFWGGLCHACSPIKQAIFELNRNGVWTEATSRHRQLVEERIKRNIRTLHEAKARGRENEIGTAALNLYLDAESANQVARYRDTVKTALKDIGWVSFIRKIDQAAARRCNLAETK